MQLAHQIFLKAEAIAKKIKLDRILAHIEGSIGEIYSQMGHFEEAIFWYKKSLKAIQKWSHDKRSLYVIHSYFAEVYFAKDEPEKAKTEMEKVLKILKESGFHDCLMKMKFVEILLYLDHLTEAERKLLEIDQEKKQKFLPTQNAYYMFLLGFLEYKKKNYGNSQEFLQKSMLQADELGNENLSSKTLVLLSMLFLRKYSLTTNVEELIEADKCIEDIITYLEEKAKFASLSIMYLIRAKIKIMLLDFETALFLLKKGEELSRTYTPELIDDYRKKIALVKEAC